jgi:hypothetical protein
MPKTAKAPRTWFWTYPAFEFFLAGKRVQTAAVSAQLRRRRAIMMAVGCIAMCVCVCVCLRAWCACVHACMHESRTCTHTLHTHAHIHTHTHNARQERIGMGLRHVS